MMYTSTMLGKLYVVATPIGNLQDIGYRAVDILNSVDLILAEDTRKTKILLGHFDIDKKLVSYHQYSQHKHGWIVQLLNEGKDIALVTDAGTPGISDPGNELLDYIYSTIDSSSSEFFEASQSLATRTPASVESKLSIIPVPGASSLTALLSVSGFNVNKFVFLGFLPKNHRKRLFEWLKEGEIAFSYLESPHRIVKSLKVVGEFFGNEKRIIIGRELTKIYETLYRGTISEVTAELEKGKVKGEVTVVVEL